jgi:hypothetical protein
MRSNLEFRSVSCDETNVNDDLPRGQYIARIIAAELPKYGFHVEKIDFEDWGWYIKVTDINFALLIGCGAYPQYDDGHLCFIEAKEQSFRRWFRRTSTLRSVERLATALEAIVQQSGKSTDLRWWTEAENAQGYASRRGENLPSVVDLH